MIPESVYDLELAEGTEVVFIQTGYGRECTIQAGVMGANRKVLTDGLDRRPCANFEHAMAVISADARPYVGVDVAFQRIPTRQEVCVAALRSLDGDADAAMYRRLVRAMEERFGFDKLHSQVASRLGGIEELMKDGSA